MAKPAHYRFEVKVISRGKNARSVVAKAAYRSGSRLRDLTTGRTYNYTARSQEVVLSAILTPANAPRWMQDEQKLWNAVEAVSTRSNARMAREFLPSIPRQLSEQQGKALILGWAQEELVARGMVAHVCIHRSKDGHNPHAHILCTTRDINPDAQAGFGNVNTGWNEVALLEHLRASYATAVNKALADAGCRERVDHRSLKAQGIDRLPEPKIGTAATAILRKADNPEPESVGRWRKVKLLNMASPHQRAIRETGSLLRDNGAAWWDTARNSMAQTIRQAVASGAAALPPPPDADGSHWRNYVMGRRQNPLDGLGFLR